MRYYLIAGERSGDLHGSNLIKALRKFDPSAELRGFGGDEMQAAGMRVHVHYSAMAFMGFVAVVTNLRKISSFLRLAKEDISSFKPDVLILIDYAGFNRRLAKFGKANGIKVFYYIAPKVWAWYTSRTWEIKSNVDRLFSILPFEKEFFKRFDWDVDYVGNPVLDAIKSFTPDPLFLKTHNLEGSRIVALLPGSRKMELKRMVPVMAEVARQNPSSLFVVAGVKTLPEKLYKPLHDLKNVRFVYDQTYNLLSHAVAAIVTSGTATLETGLFKVPQMVIYRTGMIEFFIVRALIKVRFISLINLIADRAVIKEFIQQEMTLQNLDDELKRLVEPGAYRLQMIKDYDEIYRTLDTGSASETTAKLMINYLRN